MAPIYGDRMLGVVFLVCVVTVFLVGRTLCVHQYDRDVLLHIRDTMSECDMQPNYRFNDIVLPGQNWVTGQPITNTIKFSFDRVAVLNLLPF